MNIKFQLFAFLLASLSVPKAYTQQKDLNLGATDFPPYSIEKGFVIKEEKKVGDCTIPKGTFYGIDPDFAQEAIKRAGLKAKLSFVPFARLKDDLRSGKLDLSSGFFYAEDSGKPRYQFIKYDIGGSTSLYKKKDSKVNVTKVADMKGLRIGVVRDDSYGPDWDKAVKDGFVEIKPAYQGNSDIQNLEKLVDGRMDLVAVNTVVGKYLVANNAIKDKVELIPFSLKYGEDPKVDGIYIALSQKVDAATVAKLKEAVDKMISEKTLNCIRLRYGITSNE